MSIQIIISKRICEYIRRFEFIRFIWNDDLCSHDFDSGFISLNLMVVIQSYEWTQNALTYGVAF